MKPRSSRSFPTSLVTVGSIFAVLAGHSALADTIAGTGWLGGASTSWANATNWTATGPSTGGSGDRNLFFGTAWKAAGSTGNTTANNDLTAWAGYRITFDSITGPVTFTLTGNAITLYDFGAANFPKIENLSTVVQNVNLAVTLNGTSATGQFAEIDPTNGDLSFGSTVDLAGTTQLRVFGATGGKTLTFNGAISSTGNSGNNSVSINSNNIVVYKAANSYAGDTFINAGRLEMASGSSIANSQIQLGDTAGTAAAEFRLTQNGGYNFNRNITVRSGSSGDKTINSTNTTGINTLGGTVTLNAANTNINASAGGTLNFTNVIAGTGGIIFNGGGTFNLSSAGSYTTSAGTYFSVASGILNMSAPVTVAPTYRMNVGWNNTNPAIINVTNTTFTLNSSVEVNVGGGYNGIQATGTGTINIGGTSLNPAFFNLGTTTSDITLGVISTAVGTGTINLNAYGTLATSRRIISKGKAGSALVNFDGGTLKLTGAQANMIDAAVVTTIKGGGATIDTNNFAGTLNSALLAGTGSGGLTKTGSGTLGLSAANTYTGPTTLSQGTLTVTNLANGEVASGIGASTNSASNLVFDGGTLAYTGATTSINRGFTINASRTATFEVTNALTFTGGLIAGAGAEIRKTGDGTLVLDSSAASLSLAGMQSGAGTLELKSGSFALTAAASTTYAAGMDGFSVVGGSTFRLSGATVTASSGTGYIFTAGHTGGGSGAFILDSGSFDGGNLEVLNAYGADGATTINGGTFTAGAFRVAQSTNGALTLNGGTLSVNSLTYASGTGTVNFNGGVLKAKVDTSTFTNATLVHKVKIGGAIIDTNGKSITFNDVLEADSSTGGITKQGTGTLTLSGINTYTGTTTIKAGTLSLGSTGSIANSSNIIVGDAGSAGVILDVSANTSGLTLGSSQRLSGIGTVEANTGTARTVTINGTHAPGNSVGKQTVDGNLNYATAASVFEWELGTTLMDSSTGARGTNYDAVNVSGNLTGTNAIFRVVLGDTTNFAATFWNADHTWTDIFKTSDAGTAVSFQSAFSASVFQYYNSAGNVGNTNLTRGFTIDGSSLKWTAVPEPTSALAGLLITAGLLRRRRQ